MARKYTEQERWSLMQRIILCAEEPIKSQELYDIMGVGARTVRRYISWIQNDPELGIIIFHPTEHTYHYSKNHSLEVFNRYYYHERKQAIARLVKCRNILKKAGASKQIIMKIEEDIKSLGGEFDEN